MSIQQTIFASSEVLAQRLGLRRSGKRYAGTSCGYEIIPLTTSADLYREGHTLHHCVGAQGDQVQAGAAYFYSVRKCKQHVATLELLRHGDGVAIGQLRGLCNSRVPKQTERAVKSWLRSQREFHFPKEREVADELRFPTEREFGAPRPVRLRKE
jgi:PcfJ-like protein